MIMIVYTNSNVNDYVIMKKVFISLLLFFIIYSGNAQIVKEDSIIIPYKYLVHIPAKTLDNGKYPLLLFLHGAGEAKDDLNALRDHLPIRFYKDSLNFPFLLIAPQCKNSQNWNPDLLVWLLNEVEKKYPVDIDRIYVTGLSMGGYGTWNFAKIAADRIAAIVPICGGSDISTICMIRHIPVWAFHGELDDTVLPSESKVLIEALHKIEADAKLTIYPDAGHVIWKETYSNTDLYKWMLSHKRIGSPLNISEKQMKQFTGEYIYSFKDRQDTLKTYVTLQNAELWYSVPRYGFKAQMYLVSKDLFRLEGVLYAGDSELKFERNTQQEIIGHRYFPCDDTFVPKTISQK